MCTPEQRMQGDHRPPEALTNPLSDPNYLPIMCLACRPACPAGSTSTTLTPASGTGAWAGAMCTAQTWSHGTGSRQPSCPPRAIGMQMAASLAVCRWGGGMCSEEVTGAA